MAWRTISGASSVSQVLLEAMNQSWIDNFARDASKQGPVWCPLLPCMESSMMAWEQLMLRV